MISKSGQDQSGVILTRASVTLSCATPFRRCIHDLCLGVKMRVITLFLFLFNVAPFGVKSYGQRRDHSVTEHYL